MADKKSKSPTKGFVTLGIDTDRDKVRYSYALALSIKHCDPTAEICLVVDKNKSNLVPKKYFDAFDYITELPFGNTGYKDGFHGSNIWQLIHATPFDKNIYVDADTIFNGVDIELLWDMFEDYEMAMPNFAKSFRNTPVTKLPMFDIELNYEMPTLFSNLIYFDRNAPIAIEWFKMADPIFQNWREAYQSLFNERKPLTFDKNVICNIVTHLLDIEPQVSIFLSDLYDLDNKSQGVWSRDIPDNWTEMHNSWFTKKQEFIIENSQLGNGIIHYRDEKFLTEEVINVLKANTNLRN